MGGNGQSRTIVKRLCEHIPRLLCAHPLLLADGILDEARRFFITSYLSGSPDEVVKEQLGTPGEAVAIAGLYIGLSIEDVLIVDCQSRLRLWIAHFASNPGTRFGAGYAKVLERVNRLKVVSISQGQDGVSASSSTSGSKPH